MMSGNSFFEIAQILGLAALLGALGQKLRQPLIIMFLATGILAGPACFGIIESYEEIELLAHMGIALLLFIVGLKLDLNLVRTTGPVALATGLGQIIFTSVAGFGIAMAFGFDFISSAYVAVALTFSSTIIIVKLLSDKKEVDSLHGQIAIGFLIVQDIAAIAALVALTTFDLQSAQEGSLLAASLLIAAKGIGFLGAIGLLMRFVLPHLLKRLAYSQEMLILFAITWAVFLGAFGELLGFSKEVGAFLAGISLASSEFRDSIASRLTSLRDFLLLFFFIDLGARLDWASVGVHLNASLWFSAFVLIGNPVIVLIIMGLMGYRARTGFMAGLTVAQISEFSLIVAALGMSLGHISKETMGLITLVGVVTIFFSTYMILYSHKLYRLLATPLKIFERKKPYREDTAGIGQDLSSVDVILVGLGNYGSGLAEQLLGRRKTVVGVDFDPGVLEKWRSRNVSVWYGDIDDPDLLEQLPLNKAQWVVSTIRTRELNLAFLQELHASGYKGKIAFTATSEEEAKGYEKAGAHVVFRPFKDAAEQAADSLTQAMDMLPENIDWPIAFREIRISSGSVFAGQALKNIPIRAETYVSILAVSRAGQIHYEPGPDFKIFPGDRLVIMGPPGELKKAESLLNRLQDQQPHENLERFDIAEVLIAEASEMVGRTLADLRFRQKYGVTVVGIRRNDEKIGAPGPDDKLQAGDHLVLIGTSSKIESITQSGSL
jgi:Kef-type K+ transport system membrane component KefB/Trk K+ transport system NAD-binding subunit